MLSKKLFTIIFQIILLCGCQNKNNDKVLTFYAFGTIIDVHLQEVTPNKIDYLNQEIENLLTSMHKRWHAWEESEITEINLACKNKNEITVKPDIAELINLGKIFEEQSLGLFNPASGRLIEEWGFFTSRPDKPRKPPSNITINKLIANKPSMQNINIKDNILVCSNENIKLDLGGFAKGYGIGKIAALLKNEQVKHALINAGGDLITIGKKANGKNWQIALENPNYFSPLANITSHDESIFTSAITRRAFKHDGKSYHHLINPITGEPATEFISVTVAHPNPTIADAAASAILIAGTNNWQKVAQNMGIKKAIIIDENMDIIVTQDFQQYIALPRKAQ